MTLTCSSQNGIFQKKVVINGDTVIIDTYDLKKEVAKLITENQILIENVDSLTYVLEDCNMNYQIQDKAIIGLTNQYNTLEKINNNSNKYIEKLEKDVSKEKKKTKIVGGVSIILLILSFLL